MGAPARIGFLDIPLCGIAAVALLVLSLCGTARAASPASAVDLLDTAVQGHRIVLLGEMHGTQEIPALVANLIEQRAVRGRREVLALEIDSAEQRRIDRFLASDGSHAARKALLAGKHWTETHHDGRDSVAMLALIERMRHLRAAGHAVPVVAFDRRGRHERNREMADDLRGTIKHFPRAQLIVLSGNVHAMTRRPPWTMTDENGKPIEPPMSAGRHLADQQPLSIDIDARTGAYWACTDGACRQQAVRPSNGPAPELDAHAALESAWDATLMLPSFTPSPPAVSAR
jgi:erythromycin esterase-like protein